MSDGVDWEYRISRGREFGGHTAPQMLKPFLALT